MLVDDTGHARLGDFGQSHASDSGKYLDSTRVGLAASPVHWMAPEIMVGGDRIKASDKSDIYSFGCVLYEVSSDSSQVMSDVQLVVLIRCCLGRSLSKVSPWEM